jgi:SAM-dependent methyltransferase
LYNASASGLQEAHGRRLIANDLQLRSSIAGVYKVVRDMATVLPLFPAVKRKVTPTGAAKLSLYAPPASVWYGDDAELLEQLLLFYPRKRPRRILDATINGGRFWRGSKRPVVGLDIDPRHHPAIVADNAKMPFRDASFDVVVYDPPHIPNQGRDKSKDFNTRFGLVLRSSKENHYTFSHTFPPFVKEAHRVLGTEGLLLCKITDYVHHHRYQWAHIDFINAAREAGLMPCDCIVKIRKGPIIDPRWKNAHHSRRQHCYWLVFRKSKKCE